MIITGSSVREFASKYGVWLLYATIILVIIFIILLIVLYFNKGNDLWIHPGNVGCTSWSGCNTGAPTGYSGCWVCKDWH